MQVMDFTLQNLPDIQPYNSVGFHATTFDNKIEMVCSVMLFARSLVWDFKREGKRETESLYVFSEHIQKAEEVFLIHQRVEQLLFADMYSNTFNLNSHSYVGDIQLEWGRPVLPQ